MTRGGVKEYIEALRERYLKANRMEKGRILDEVTEVTGYHRKAVIRLLRRSWNSELEGGGTTAGRE